MNLPQDCLQAPLVYISLLCGIHYPAPGTIVAHATATCCARRLLPSEYLPNLGTADHGQDSYHHIPEVQSVDIAGHVLGKSWTNIYAWPEVIWGLPFARSRWRSLAKTTSSGMLQSQVAGPSSRRESDTCVVESLGKVMCSWDTQNGQVVNNDKQVRHGKGLDCEGYPC